MCPWAGVLVALCTDLIPQTLPELVWGTRAWGAAEEVRAWPGFTPRALGAMVNCGFQNSPQGSRWESSGRGGCTLRDVQEKGQCGPIRRRRAWRWVGTQGPAQDGGTVSPRHLMPRGRWGVSEGLSASRQGCVCAEWVYVPSLSRRPPSWPGHPAGRCGPRGSGCGVCTLGVWVWAWGVGASLSRSSEPGSPCSQDAAPAPGRVFQHRPGGLWAQSFSRRLLRKPCEPVFV